MQLTRRQFGQVTGAAAAGVAFSGLGSDLAPVAAHARELKTKAAKETTTICPYCGVGCGAIVSTSQTTGRAINIEGDPDHVINRGSLCSKGSALYQLAENKNRLTRPMYRGPGEKQFKPVRTEAIASIGSAALDNEECSLYQASAAQPWPGVRGTPGPYMTLRYCCGSGRVVRQRSNDEPLDRSQEQ
jgi:formate dehydrogenase major subunit